LRKRIVKVCMPSSDVWAGHSLLREGSPKLKKG